MESEDDLYPYTLILQIRPWSSENFWLLSNLSNGGDLIVFFVNLSLNDISSLLFLIDSFCCC